MINVGVIGFGYWGPNVVRNMMATPGIRVQMVCDQDSKNLSRAKGIYSRLRLTTDYKEVTDSSSIDAVAIVTPVSTHYEIAKRALMKGKHIFIEKPLARTSKEAEDLIRMAEAKKLVIMVDHTFLFTGAVGKIKELIDANVLGDLYYYDSTRISLGLFQNYVNVIWDLAPHDFYIIDYLFKNKPHKVSATGLDHFNRGHENIAYITIYLKGGLIAHINANWLSPVKVRNILIGGQKKMLIWDDLEVDERLKIYDKGITLGEKEGIYKMLVDYRSGDMVSPKLDSTEALKKEMVYFHECITTKKEPFNDGHAGLRVVKLLEAASQSLKQDGRHVNVNIG
ncbi:MAG: Gfo/Idh/MocA family oxidoreductase [Candidatus Omnitrophica bacterium]|nr:Gfo/Idh/MocA family oxidoreductase [Candidatus Omnitrophota bacterium]